MSMVEVLFLVCVVVAVGAWGLSTWCALSMWRMMMREPTWTRVVLDADDDDVTVDERPPSVDLSRKGGA